jgi:hypothetical protein
MKKAVIILLTMILAMTNIIQVIAANGQSGSGLPEATYSDPDASRWTMGYKKNENGMTTGVQGSNGWYCLYTTETNKNGSFNLQLMQPTEWGRTSNCWKYYSVSNNWSPGIYLESGYDFSGNSNWWLMDGNGRLDPNVATGEVTGAYAWAAPTSGKYSISMDYVAGGSNQIYSGVRYFAKDGVTLSINTSAGILQKFKAPATTARNIKLSEGNLSTSVSLKTGEMVYFIVDPQKNGSYAHAELKINITQDEKSEDEKSEDDEKKPSAGENDSNTSVSDGANTGISDFKDTGDSDNSDKEDQSDSDDSKEKKEETEKKSQGNDKNSSSGGEGDGSGGLSDDTQVAQSLPSDLPDVTSEEFEETDDEDSSSVLVLSKDAGKKLTLALSKQEENVDESTAESTTAMAQGELSQYSGEITVLTDEQKSTRILLIALVEMLVIGIVLGAGKYYMNS